MGKKRRLSTRRSKFGRKFAGHPTLKNKTNPTSETSIVTSEESARKKPQERDVLRPIRRKRTKPI